MYLFSIEKLFFVICCQYFCNRKENHATVTDLSWQIMICHIFNRNSSYRFPWSKHYKSFLQCRFSNSNNHRYWVLICIIKNVRDLLLIWYYTIRRWHLVANYFISFGWSYHKGIINDKQWYSVNHIASDSTLGIGFRNDLIQLTET